MAAWRGVAGNGVAVGSVCVVLFIAFTSLTRRGESSEWLIFEREGERQFTLLSLDKYNGKVDRASSQFSLDLSSIPTCIDLTDLT